jgi:hypothetical protein
MMLFWPYDPKVVFNRLTHIDLTYFFIIIYFTNSSFNIRSDMIDLKLSFIIYFL